LYKFLPYTIEKIPEIILDFWELQALNFSLFLINV